MDTFDIGIIGSGVAGTFAAHRIATKHKDKSVILMELGSAPAKRRSQMCGFLGLLPNSDGKLYLPDIAKVAELTSDYKAKKASKWVLDLLKNVANIKTIKDKPISLAAEKRIKNSGYEVKTNNYIQLYPKDIHLLSRLIAADIEQGGNVLAHFDNEALQVHKQKGSFLITTETREYKCKRLILCTGRSGWRWARDLYANFGIIEDNDTARFGIRIEMPAANLKEFSKSNCSIIRNDGLIEVGPLSWNGTVIPEDHVDMAISAFRSNENRWKTDKVSFNFIGNIHDENHGFEQTDRIGKLIFVLSNDRIVKEKVSAIINGKSRLSIIPEYNWLPQYLTEFAEVMPDILTKAYFHVPTIVPLPPKINISNGLATDVSGMYVAGENAGITGLFAAAIMGVISGDAVCK